jgi:hypothetical protein
MVGDAGPMTAVLDDQPVNGTPSSGDAWHRAWWEFVHVNGDPVATLQPPNSADDGFVLGPVFVAIYSMLGGLPRQLDAITTAVRLAHERVGPSERERAFVAAMDLVVRGDFTQGANVLDHWASDARDFAAVRIVRDIALHIGDNPGRLRSSTQVVDVYAANITDATSVFRLADVTSLLWRLELAGHDVGERWATVADRWDAATERHTCAFLDVHAAMACGCSRSAGAPRRSSAPSSLHGFST